MVHHLTQSRFNNTARSAAASLVLFLLANLVILLPAPLPVRAMGALFLFLFLPGWYWGRLFSTDALEPLERLIVSIGLSLALMILGTLFLSYMPGSLTLTKVIVGIDALILLGFVLAAARSPTRHMAQSWSRFNSRSLATILGLLVLAVLLRLPMLGYAEFHEDEAEVLMLGTRLFQGERYALFLHRKGPAQMLVPITSWLLNGRITETLARFPFAISSILSVGTILLMGCRWRNNRAGFIAALLWAVNGYAIAFGRMVQYQSIILFLGPLAIYCQYLAWRQQRPRLQLIAASLLAASLLAHFDAWFLLPSSLYLWWLIIKQQGSYKISWWAVGIFTALVATFYIPFLLDPEFSNTAAYLRESRIRPGGLYNHLDKLQQLDKIYSSHFYLPVLALGIAGLVLQHMHTSLGLRRPLLGLNLGLVGSTVIWPEMWEIGQVSLAIIPWLILLGLCFWVAETVEIKLMWSLFAVPMLGYVFIVGDPRTHVVLAYIGAVLLAGSGLYWLAEMSVNFIVSLAIPGLSAPGQPVSPYPRRIAKVGLVAFGAAILVLCIAYISLIYLRPESYLNRLRTTWDGSIWETLYDDLPKAESYFGYPKQTGWKAVGALRQQGLLSNDYKSLEEDFIIPVWYMQGQASSCRDQPTHYFVPLTGADLSGQLSAYTPIAQIKRENENTLQIFSVNKTESGPTIYHFEAFKKQFDQQATPQQFTPDYQPQHALEVQFGNDIALVGYDLPTTALSAGEMLQVQLYWLALSELETRYRAFVHLVNQAGLWSQHDDDPICRLPTNVWRTGQRGVGYFRLPINSTIPPGTYSVIVGLYDAETQFRLRITAGGPKLGDDFLWLGDVQVVK